MASNFRGFGEAGQRRLVQLKPEPFSRDEDGRVHHLQSNWPQYCTALGGVLTFGVATWRYLDTRKRELQGQRFVQFHRVFAWVAGRTPEGNLLVDTQQAIAVYELSEFREYCDMSLPIVDYYLKETSSDADDSLFRAALIFASDRLTKSS